MIHSSHTYLHVLIVDFVLRQRHLWIFFQVRLDPSYGQLYFRAAAKGVDWPGRSTFCYDHGVLQHWRMATLAYFDLTLVGLHANCLDDYKSGKDWTPSR